MILLAALAWAAQGPDLLHRLVPNPTGKNGYEEYLQAADLLRGPVPGVFASWTPGAKPPARDPDDPTDPGPSREVVHLYATLGAMAPLDVRREELRRFGRALDLVARGNAKPVFDPRGQMDAATTFPEYASFRYTSRFAARAATVYAADGQTGRAADVLLDEIVAADNFGRGAIISHLVGVANEAIALSAFVGLLPRLSRVDALRVERAVGGVLARPLAVRATIPAETALAAQGVRQLLAAKQVPPGYFSIGDDERPDPKAERMAKRLTDLSPAGRADLLRNVVARIEARARAMDRVLTGPEGKWHDGFAALDDEADDPLDLGDALLSALTPVYTQYVDAAVRMRTQLRLLSLHARLVAYRWDTGRFPEALDDVDPLSGERYVYELRPDGTVRLASKGIPSTGEIELKYKRPTQDEGAKP